MKKVFFVLLLSGIGWLHTSVWGQGFQQEIEQHRAHYRAEFLTSANSPLKQDDLPYLRFFAPDSTYRVQAAFQATPASEPFDMPTYSGIKKTFVKYGELLFRLHGEEYRLSLYRNLALQAMPQYKNYLFLPFKDLTNAHESYGGGRYLDFETTDIRDSVLIVDFNKAYNPYCAYSDGYNCPIPPRENHLSLRIEAGEQNFGKSH